MAKVLNYNTTTFKVEGLSALPITLGGTNITSYTIGDILYADTTTSLAKLPDVATGNVLKSGGVGVAPSYGKINLGTDVTAITASRALVSDASGFVSSSAVTSTELSFVSGVTSAIQTQLNAKQATITGAATSIVSSNLTANRAVTTDASGKVTVSATTDTELGYVSGVTSSIQTQINNKAINAPSDEFLVDIHAQSNTILSGAQSVDGYTTTSGELVCCTAQTATAENGPWITSAGAWTRPIWWAAGSTQKTGISFKSSGKGTNWANHRGQVVSLTNITDILVNTTGLTFSPPMTMESSGLSLGRWWTGVNQSISLYSAGGSTAVATITRASGANGNFTIASTGTGVFALTNNATTILTTTSNTAMTIGCALAAATLQLGSSTQTTGNITIGPALTTGTITLGNATGTGVHRIQSTPVSTSPSLQITANQAASSTVLALGNINAATTASKSVDILLGADATPQNNIRIRGISENAFAWNSASQQTSLRFGVGFGVSVVDGLIIKPSATTGTSSFVGIGSSVAPAAKLHISTDATSSASWTTNGIGVRIDSTTYTDTSTAIAGTVAHHAINSLSISTIAATNTTVTNTNASTLYISGAPAAGTNVTITNPWSVYINAGNSFFGGSIRLNNLTASTVPVLNASKDIISSVVTSTELGFVSGVTSAIQTQLNSKQASDAGLTALAALTGIGYIKETGTDTFLLAATIPNYDIAYSVLTLVPTDGGTTTMNTATYDVIIEPTAQISSYTIIMPSTGSAIISNAIYTISCTTFGITSLTLNPVGPASATFVSGAAITSIMPGESVTYQYNGSSNKWYKLSHTQKRGNATITYYTPTTGSTISLAAASESNIIEPISTIATLTINMPTTPYDGQIYNISTGNFGVTTLTLNAVGPTSATFATNAVVSKLMAGDAVAYQYRTATNRWYRYSAGSAYIDQKDATGSIYTLISSDNGKTVYINNTLTVPSLPANTQIEVFNEAATSIAITFSGVSVKGNNTLTNIAAESYAVFTWKDTTNVRAYGSFA